MPPPGELHYKQEENTLSVFFRPDSRKMRTFAPVFIRDENTAYHNNCRGCRRVDDGGSGDKTPLPQREGVPPPLRECRPQDGPLRTLHLRLKK